MLLPLCSQPIPTGYNYTKNRFSTFINDESSKGRNFLVKIQDTNNEIHSGTDVICLHQARDSHATGNRTRISTLKGWRTKPLFDGAIIRTHFYWLSKSGDIIKDLLQVFLLTFLYAEMALPTRFELVFQP